MACAGTYMPGILYSVCNIRRDRIIIIFIWLVGAVFFGLVFAVRVLEIKGIIHVAKVLRICFIVIMAAGASLFIFTEALIIKGMMEKPRITVII